MPTDTPIQPEFKPKYTSAQRRMFNWTLMTDMEEEGNPSVFLQRALPPSGLQNQDKKMLHHRKKKEKRLWSSWHSYLRCLAAVLVPLYPDHRQLTGGYTFWLFAQCKYNELYLPFNPFVATTCFKMWKFLSHFPLRLSLSYPFFMRFEIEPHISETTLQAPRWVLVSGQACWHQGAKAGGSPAGLVIGLHHPRNETSHISIPAWHTPDKSCHLITTERVREAKELWGVRCKEGRKTRFFLLIIRILMTEKQASSQAS